MESMTASGTLIWPLKSWTSYQNTAHGIEAIRIMGRKIFQM